VERRRTAYEAKHRVTEEEFASFQREFQTASSRRHGKVRPLLYMPEMPAEGHRSP
jgi:hypothetical protein